MRKLRNGGYVNVSKRRDYSSNLSFCDVFRSFLFGLYLFHHPEKFPPHILAMSVSVNPCSSRRTVILMKSLSHCILDPASTVEVRANAHVVLSPATSTMCSRCFMKSVRLVFLASGFRTRLPGRLEPHRHVRQGRVAVRRSDCGRVCRWRLQRSGRL